MKKIILFVLAVSVIVSLVSCKGALCQHTYEESVVAPNCNSEGYTEHTCSKCGDSYTDSTTPKTVHRFAGGACSNCGMEEITENIEPDTEWYHSDKSVYNLTTKEQLAGLASLVNSGNSFDGKTIYLDADIDLGYYEWIPIGTENYAFRGTFDGDGHKITGLKINADINYVGLFGNATGKISNFDIVNANVFVKRDHYRIGIVVGDSSGVITNVSTSGFLEAPKSNFVGAIAGVATPSNVIYTNLFNSASVVGQDQVGGIFGNLYANGSVQTDVLSNTGDVTGAARVGGIVGNGYAKANSTIYGAKVSANIVGDYYVGGVAGYLDNISISHCENEGSTVASDSYCTEGDKFYVWLGGYVGYGYNVDNCINKVNITYDARGIYVGGIAGTTTGEIKDCTNIANIITETDCVGGIVGRANINALSAGLTYSNLTNTGNVVGKNNVGGISGHHFHAHMNKSVNSGKVEGRSAVGGVIGYYSTEYYSYGWYYYAEFSLLSNSGTVSGEEYVGGIVGNSYAINSYSGSGNIAYITCTQFGNSGSVIGKSADTTGEMFGKVYAEAESTLAGYTVLGKITVNGELLEGEYDVGSNTNLKLSERKVSE